MLAGLIIGKITGNYPIAIIVSLAIDLDHIISFYRHGVLFNFKKLLKEALDEKDPWGDQRNILHNVFVFIIISFLVIILNSKIALVFSLAYLTHLFLDAINGSPLYPLYPSKKFATKGFIKYNSKQEIMFDACLAIILALIFIIKI
jgi:archaellum biogenesis protein FlaJ (TadC family)